MRGAGAARRSLPHQSGGAVERRAPSGADVTQSRTRVASDSDSAVTGRTEVFAFLGFLQGVCCIGPMSHI
jgi:hypothetical protein